MANAYSSNRNPALQNVDHPFTEIFQLLQQLPSVPKGITSYSDDELNIANALQQHAETASQTIISGIQSLGVILATAADNQDMGLNLNDISAIGWLLNSLGELLENCYTYSKQNN